MITTAVTVSTLADTIARAAAEYAAIHEAACRYRRQGLVCSTCSGLAERAERLARRAGLHVGEAA
ncbi:MAG TPA: hypothetical protein VFH48_37435 [Chloroflexota bacterium]|nr:hypothetical protein [Chloroflexota bacterium]